MEVDSTCVELSSAWVRRDRNQAKKLIVSSRFENYFQKQSFSYPGIDFWLLNEAKDEDILTPTHLPFGVLIVVTVPGF